MTKRTWLVAAGGMVLIGLAAAALAILADRSPVNRANYDRITVGMTRADVEELFAGEGVPFHGYPNKGPYVYCWESENGSAAIVLFGDDQTVVEKLKWQDSSESLFDRVRRLIRRAWR